MLPLQLPFPRAYTNIASPIIILRKFHQSTNTSILNLSVNKLKSHYPLRIRRLSFTAIKMVTVEDGFTPTQFLTSEIFKLRHVAK